VTNQQCACINYSNRLAFPGNCKQSTFIFIISCHHLQIQISDQSDVWIFQFKKISANQLSFLKLHPTVDCACIGLTNQLSFPWFFRQSVMVSRFLTNHFSVIGISDQSAAWWSLFFLWLCWSVAKAYNISVPFILATGWQFIIWQDLKEKCPLVNWPNICWKYLSNTNFHWE
jgi:hypothetical protein